MMIILLPPDAYVWLLALGLLLVSVLVFGHAFRSYRRSRHLRLCQLLGPAVVAVGWCVLLYSAFVEVSCLKVRRIEFVSADLPPAFDGYRIVQFSDAHVGSFTGWREAILSTAIDSINAQQADMIVFTGDLQNKLSDEIDSKRTLLASLKAPDGVYSILGNHDYPEYVDVDEQEEPLLLSATCAAERSLGWTLLCNEHRTLYRGGDSLVIAGMENDGEGRFPQLGDPVLTLQGLGPQPFIVMLEHDPTSWHRKILPQTRAQLTLSGHTHGGQFALFGWTPASYNFPELGGMYYEGDRALNVSTGLGGVIPMRLGVTPEIVVITLRLRE